jgi:class 3 adenylate cyclase/tetratricopeptide (TPR) repeat protein
MNTCAACGAALPEAARFCPACSAPVEGKPDESERKLATVVFADLVGSTELGASQDPERTRALLDRFYDAMAGEIDTAGGTIEKFAGDAVMAVFGAPASLEDHAERALHAALAMQRRLLELFGKTLVLRIGVNTGEVVVGKPREGSSFVTGDAVNVAARLEQAAEPGDILVGERAAALAAAAFEFEAPLQVEAKGKPGGVACRRLVRALSLMRPRGIPGLRPSFVGRDQELALIQRAYERAVSRREPQLVTIMGEAGVGKTRLVRELWEWLGHESPDALRRTGRCPPYGHALTYRPLGEILKEHFGVLDSDPPERVLALLGKRDILALALGLDVASDLHPIIARDRLHDAWLELVEELASDRPLVLLVEDLHWAEEPLLELLERTLQEVQAPVLLLGTARPEFLDRSPTWGRGRAPSEWIWLEPLSADDAHRLVEDVAETEVPSSVRELLGRAEGNPLFLEELLVTLIECGALRPGEGWELALLPVGAGVPDSVRAVLAARIDLLPPGEKATLQAASIIGRAFWSSAVRELLGDVEPDFHVLEQRDFVRRRSGSSLGGEREFVFKHALTREVVYASVMRRDRARLHAKFASWLEQRGGRDEDASLLALHYAEAVRPENSDLAWADEPVRREQLRASAVVWLRRAAELAAGRYEVEEALALLNQAVEIGIDDRITIEIHREIARTHTLRYDSQSCRRSLERALALGPDPPVEAEIYAQLAYYGLGRPYMWKEPPPRELGEQWLARALELSEPGTEARGWALVAKALADPSTGAEAAAESHGIGEALGHPRLVVYACEAQTLAATEAGRYVEACEWVDRALEAAPALRDPGFQGHQYWNAGFVYLRAGRIRDVRQFAETYHRLASSLSPHEEVHVVALHALLESVLGDWDVFAELTRRAETATGANEDFPCQFNWRNLLVCALGHAHLGKEREVRRLEEIGRANAVVAGPPEREPALLRLALLRGDLDAAHRILEALPPTGDAFGLDAAAARLDALLALGEAARVEEEAEPFLGRESYTRPFALRAVGISRGDASLVEQSAVRFEAMGLAWRAEETRTLFARARKR